MHTPQRDDTVKRQQEVSHLQAKETGLRKKPTLTVPRHGISSLQNCENKFLWLKPWSLWSFVMIALVN